MSLEAFKSEKDLVNALKNRTKFERDVYVETYKIPKGKISTYKGIAEKIGRPKAYRAVGNALHKNTLSPIVPCHRVVAFDGSFSGEKEGAERRRIMVEKEGIPIKNGKVIISKKILH